jgi:hypothetical protein
MIVTRAILFVAVGFAAGVWGIAAKETWRRHRWLALGYGHLAFAFVMSGVILGGRLGGAAGDIPPWLSTLVLLPIIVVPAALELHARLKTRRLVELFEHDS